MKVKARNRREYSDSDDDAQEVNRMKRKNLLALLLALVMILPLAGCGGASKEALNQPEFSSDEWAAIWATIYVRNYLLDVLKKPSSLEINSIKGAKGSADDLDGAYFFEIDYSAENGFGGSNRDQLYIAIEDGSSAERGSSLSVGSSTFDGADNQRYTKKYYDSLSGNRKSYPVEKILGEAEKYDLD